VRDTIKGVSKMALWGIPGYLIAFLLNYGLNELFGWNVYFAYFIVSIVVTTLNFFIIDQIVFKGEKGKNLSDRIGGYLSVVYSSKLGEWMLYSLLVWISSIHYLIVQFIVSAIFVFYKYFFLKKVHD
jgi:putative flippase GtrA